VKTDSADVKVSVETSVMDTTEITLVEHKHHAHPFSSPSKARRSTSPHYMLPQADPDSDSDSDLEFSYRRTLSVVSESVSTPLKSIFKRLKKSVRLASTFELQMKLDRAARMELKNHHQDLATVSEAVTMNDAAKTSSSLNESSNEDENMVRMFPPARVYQLVLEPRTRSYTARQTEPLQFQHIPLGGSQFSDHVPNLYERAFTRCLAGMTATEESGEQEPGSSGAETLEEGNLQ
jgi:hypothetical protein